MALTRGTCRSIFAVPRTDDGEEGIEQIRPPIVFTGDCPSGSPNDEVRLESFSEKTTSLPCSRVSQFCRETDFIRNVGLHGEIGEDDTAEIDRCWHAFVHLINESLLIIEAFL